MNLNNGGSNGGDSVWFYLGLQVNTKRQQQHVTTEQQVFHVHQQQQQTEQQLIKTLLLVQQHMLKCAIANAHANRNDRRIEK